MTSNFQLYRGAARRIRNGWSRGWRNDRGGVCLVQSVLDEAGWRSPNLPCSMIDDIDASLQQYRSYRVMRSIHLGGSDWSCSSRQDLIMAWNDVMGSKDRVAHALETLADKQELEFLRAEQLRLQIEVYRLTTQVEGLTAERTRLTQTIAELEAQNRRWRRWMNAQYLAGERHQLDQLDQQLDARWEQLTQKQDELTADRFAPLA